MEGGVELIQMHSLRMCCRDVKVRILAACRMHQEFPEAPKVSQCIPVMLILLYVFSRRVYCGGNECKEEHRVSPHQITGCNSDKQACHMWVGRRAAGSKGGRAGWTQIYSRFTSDGYLRHLRKSRPSPQAPHANLKRPTSRAASLEFRVRSAAPS